MICRRILVGALITQKPSSVTVEEGQNVSLQCKAIGMPKPVVTWERAFSNLPIGRTAVIGGSLKISNIAKADSGAYACSAKNLLGKHSAVALVVVTDRLRIILAPPSKVTTSESSNLLLECAAQGNTEITWKLGTGRVLPRNHVVYPNGTLLLRSVVANDAGTYSCVAKNALRSVKETSIMEVILKSCSSIKSGRSGSSSGNYIIDPDGKGLRDSVQCVL